MKNKLSQLLNGERTFFEQNFAPVPLSLAVGFILLTLASCGMSYIFIF